MIKLITAFLVFFISYSNLSYSADQSIAVKKFVNDVGNNIINIANQKNLDSKTKKQKIITIIDDAVDSKWIGRFILGKNYRLATNQQKQRFFKLYRQFMINTYGPKFQNYNGRKFEVTKVEKQGRYYIAKSEFLPRDSDIAVLIDFRVRKINNKLVILDFIAEGVSLLETRRSEFNSAIARQGIDKFLDDLSQKVEKLQQ